MNIRNEEYASKSITFNPFPGPDRIIRISQKDMFMIRKVEDNKVRNKEQERKRNQKDVGLRDLADNRVCDLSWNSVNRLYYFHQYMN